MLEAFPALQKLADHEEVWADLQFAEAEAIINTMLTLKRVHGVASLSTHDGILVPRPKVALAKAVLTEQFKKQVGVKPVLTVELSKSAKDA
jgi:hypothetical protein